MRILFLLASMLLPLLSHAGKFSYDPEANPYELLSKSVSAAATDNKLILVVFGSDWCPDCRSLNKKMTMEPLSKIIDRRFVVMNVDIGRWDKNIEFTKDFGTPIDSGIPSIAILGSDKEIHYVAEAGEFATARNSKVKTLQEWFVAIDEKITDAIEFRKADKTLPSGNAAK